MFAKQKSRPLVGVGSYLLAAVLGYLAKLPHERVRNTTPTAR
jgi:hypothetical protein